MRRLLVGSALALGMLAVGLAQVGAFPNLLTAAVTEYPHIGGTRLDDCAICHIGSSSALNPYGIAFEGANDSFSAIEGQDSDGDGFSNIAEILALTFPGDGSDKPAGGGGGGERVLSRGTLEPGATPSALAAATDVDRDEGFIVWAEDAAVRDGAKTHGGVTGWLVDDEGSPIKKAASFAVGDVAGEHGVGAAYAVKKKRFLATYTSAADTAMGQMVKSKTNKLSGKPFEIGTEAIGPVPDWDADLGQFLVATQTVDGVGIDQVSTKGKVSRYALGRATEIIADFAVALGFATGPLDSGRLLLAGADTRKGIEPGTALLEEGLATSVETGVAKASKKGTGMAAAMMDGATGMYVARAGTKLTTGEIDTDGTILGKGSKLKGAKAGMSGVAAQSDGTFLVVWVDSKKGTLLAVDRSADGKTTSKSFELHADGENVLPNLLAVVPLGDAVLVVYVTDGDPGEVRTVVVGPAE